MANVHVPWKSAFLLLILSIAPISISCQPEPLAPQEATVYIINPGAGSNIAAGDITVRTFINNFELVDKIGEQNSPGEGHIIYYLDVEPPREQGKEALTPEGSYFTSTEKSLTWRDVKAGAHIFWVQLVNNDNTPLEPPSAVSVPITVTSR